MEDITHNKKAFTLIELLISVAVFALVIAAAMGIFISSMKGKERVNQLKEIEDNARYAMEMMSREIRMAQTINSPVGANPSLDFDNSSSANIIYALGGAGGTVLTKNGLEITSEKVKVNHLTFYVNDFDLCTGPQSSVTISMTIEAVKNPLVKMDFQTTVSSRIY